MWLYPGERSLTGIVAQFVDRARQQTLWILHDGNTDAIVRHRPLPTSKLDRRIQYVKSGHNQRSFLSWRSSPMQISPTSMAQSLPCYRQTSIHPISPLDFPTSSFPPLSAPSVSAALRPDTPRIRHKLISIIVQYLEDSGYYASALHLRDELRLHISQASSRSRQLIKLRSAIT
jgi:hypothetical protein